MSHAYNSRRSTGQRRKALAQASGSAPSFDDWHEAYEEAAGHLEYVAGCGTKEDIGDGEREAMRRLAARLRAAAKRIKPNTEVRDGGSAPFSGPTG